jgi:hypothetical protein
VSVVDKKSMNIDERREQTLQRASGLLRIIKEAGEGGISSNIAASKLQISRNVFQHVIALLLVQDLVVRVGRGYYKATNKSEDTLQHVAFDQIRRLLRGAGGISGQKRKKKDLVRPSSTKLARTKDGYPPTSEDWGSVNNLPNSLLFIEQPGEGVLCIALLGDADPDEVLSGFKVSEKTRVWVATVQKASVSWKPRLVAVS